MQISIVIEGTALTAFTRALEAQNAQRAVALTEQEFLQGLVDDICSGYSQRHLVTEMNPYQFMQERFTQQERIDIHARAQTDARAHDFVIMLEKAPRVRFAHPMVIEGLSYFESVGSIGPGRAAEILSP